jgi:hypothetical protein
MKVTQKHLTWTLMGLFVILVGYAALRGLTGFRLPPKVDAELPNFVMMGAVAVFLYGRKLRSDQSKAAAAAAAAAKAEAEALQAEPVDPEDPDLEEGDGPGGSAAGSKDKA